MRNVAICVDNLGKQYRVGGPRARHDTLGESLAASMAMPLRRLVSAVSRRREASSEAIWALKDVSFQVHHGEVVGIIGPNGAGKTTILKVLSRITTPTEGYAEIRGRAGSLLEVGTGFHRELTGRENVYLYGAILGMKRAEIAQKFDEIVAFSEVETFLDTPLKHYSSGMRVRLAFAVAAHLEPEILLVDEVLAVGDTAFQSKCLGKMEDVAQRGRTVLFVSHNMGMIRNLCSRAILLDSGRLQADGAVGNVIDHYLKDVTGAEPRGVVCFGPGDQASCDIVSLSQVRLVQEGDISSGLVAADKPLDIEIHYVLKEDVTPFRVKIRIYSQEGVELVRSDDTIGHPERDVRTQGAYVSRCRVPAYLFNTQRYYLSVAIDLVRIRALIPSFRVLSFDVIDTSGTVRHGKNSGIIHPYLAWECHHLAADRR